MSHLFDPYASDSSIVTPRAGPTALVATTNQPASQWAVPGQQQQKQQQQAQYNNNGGYSGYNPAAAQQQQQHQQYQQQQYMQQQQQQPTFAQPQMLQQQQPSFHGVQQQPQMIQVQPHQQPHMIQSSQQQQQAIVSVPKNIGFPPQQQQQSYQLPPQQLRPTPPPSDLDVFLNPATAAANSSAKHHHQQTQHHQRPPTTIVDQGGSRHRVSSSDSVSTMSTHRTEMHNIRIVNNNHNNTHPSQQLPPSRSLQSPSPQQPPSVTIQEIVPYNHNNNNNSHNHALPPTTIPRILAQNAAPGSSPLPNIDLVVQTGYILSRISLRTIFMKVWKQTYWMQYGPTVLLLFRNKEDADDWLTNPYHTLKERNFLIKLKVDFVRDLHKANVKGYRAAKTSTKSYQNSLYHQFKLERWMDYGPAIACAFASPEVQEAQQLRDVILKCMQNSPQNNNIARANPHTIPRSDDDSRAYSVDDVNVRPHETALTTTFPLRSTQSCQGDGYFQYDEGLLAAEKVQMRQAEQTVARGRYNNY